MATFGVGAVYDKGAEPCYAGVSPMAPLFRLELGKLLK